MPTRAAAALWLALAAFALFFTDVALGALRMPGFLGDVAEALVLLAASLLFVAGVLGREAEAHEKRLEETARED